MKYTGINLSEAGILRRALGALYQHKSEMIDAMKRTLPDKTYFIYSSPFLLTFSVDYRM